MPNRGEECILKEIISSGCDCGQTDSSSDLLIEALARMIERQRGEPIPRAGNPIESRLESVCFRALVDMIESNSGVGFVNVDQGHSAYALGRSGTIDPVMGGDSPEANRLFKVLQQFPTKCHEEIQDLHTWSKFCEFAFAAAQRSK